MDGKLSERAWYDFSAIEEEVAIFASFALLALKEKMMIT